MLPYWVLFAFFAVGALTTPPDLRPKKPWGLLLAGLLLLTFMIGLRNWVGTDFANYLKAWTPADQMTLERYLRFRPGDPVFYTLLWGMRNLGWPYWSLNLLCAAIFCIGLFRFARMQPNSWLAISVALPYLAIVIAMSAVRQATAIGIIFLALCSFKKQDAKGFIGWTLAASLFHASAIIILPFAGLSLTKNRFQSVVLLLITGVGAYYLLGSTLGDYSRDYLGRYVSTSSGTVYRIMMSAIPAGLYLLLNRRFPFSEPERTLWRNFSLLALFSIPLMGVIQSTTVLDRLLLYAYPLQIMMLAWLPYFFRSQIQRAGIILAILGYLGLQLYVFLNYAANAHNHIPYRNFLFDSGLT